MHCELSPEGLLSIEMPFHLPPQRRPPGPSVVPIVTGEDGRRRIRYSMLIGPDFTKDDVNVKVDGLLFTVGNLPNVSLMLIRSS